MSSTSPSINVHIDRGRRPTATFVVRGPCLIQRSLGKSAEAFTKSPQGMRYRCPPIEVPDMPEDPDLPYALEDLGHADQLFMLVMEVFGVNDIPKNGQERAHWLGIPQCEVDELMYKYRCGADGHLSLSERAIMYIEAATEIHIYQAFDHTVHEAAKDMYAFIVEGMMATFFNNMEFAPWEDDPAFSRFPEESPLRFLDFPREIRDLIYEAALVPVDGVRTFDEDYPFSTARSDSLQISIHLTLANRQVRAESLPILFGRNTFTVLPRYEVPQHGEKVLGCNERCGVSDNWRRISSFSLLDNIGAAQRAKIRHLEVYIPKELICIPHLCPMQKYFPGLDTLTICFTEPRFRYYFSANTRAIILKLPKSTRISIDVSLMTEPGVKLAHPYDARTFRSSLQDRLKQVFGTDLPETVSVFCAAKLKSLKKQIREAKDRKAQREAYRGARDAKRLIACHAHGSPDEEWDSSECSSDSDTFDV